MSTDAAFVGLSFPALDTAHSQEEFERARTRGHAAGYAAGLRKAAEESAVVATAARIANDEFAAAERASVLSALRALSAATERVAVLKRPVLAEADLALAAAAIELAEVIIGRELSDAPLSARTAVRRALADVDPDDVLAVRLHPEDLAVLAADAQSDAALHFIADASLERGDAVVDVPNGSVDARISSALGRARSVLLEGQS
jgi:flagellar assembly protein FliH